MTAQPGAQEFKPGDEVTGDMFFGGQRSGTIEKFTEGSRGKFARLVSGEYLHLGSLRPASPPAEPRAEMPEDVRELLTEARKHCPHAVVELRPRDQFIIWTSADYGRHHHLRDDEFPSLNGPYWSSLREGRHNNVLNGELARAIAESRVWPLEDAKKLDEPGKSPGAKCGATACIRPAETGCVFCAQCEEANAAGVVRAVAAQMKKPDPYAIVRERHDYVNEYAEAGDKRTRETRIAAMSTDHPLSRLAARKQRQRAELFRDMSRPHTWRDRMGRETNFTGWSRTDFGGKK